MFARAPARFRVISPVFRRLSSLPDRQKETAGIGPAEAKNLGD
jgi:hypothetical protein